MKTFRRLLVVFLCGLLASILATAQSIVGDVNDDGKVNLTDVIMTISYISGNQLDVFSEANADINGDGKINLTDVTCLVNRILQKNLEIEEDVLYVRYNGKTVDIINPDPSTYQVNVSNADVEVRIVGETPNRTISIDGESADGRLRVVADTVYNLRLNGVNLTSSHAPAINSSSKQKMNVEIVDRTKNYLADAKKYSFEDATETANACFCSQGNITFTGNGSLYVEGNQKHGICSGKGMKLNQGKIYVTSAPSDAIHSGKYIYLDGAELTLNGQKQDGMDADEEIKITRGATNITISGEEAKAMKSGGDFIMKGGLVEMNLQADMSKGVKTKGDIFISGGTINATATGNVVIKDGDPTYCTIIKGDANAIISGGEFNLVSNGVGGKGISIDSNLTISNSILNATITGNGGEYINKNEELDYYTPRAIEADESLTILSGRLDIHCTGIGGKGLVCDHDLTIGELNGSNDNLTINILTEGSSIVNDTVEDFRKGCPKAIKSADQLDILSGKILIKTLGMGGEGLESKNEIWIVDGNIICNTFDDCFNGSTLIYVYGGNIYCYSHDNDGFDSNGSIVIEGGNIFSASLHPQNESFDTEGNTLVIKGGNIIGIGGSEVRPEQSLIPFYCYKFWDNQLVQQPTPIISLTIGNYLSVIRDNQCLLSARIPADFSKAIVTIASPLLNRRGEYVAAETDKIQDGNSFCNDLFVVGGRTASSIIEKFIFTPDYY